MDPHCAPFDFTVAEAAGFGFALANFLAKGDVGAKPELVGDMVAAGVEVAGRLQTHLREYEE